MGSLDRNSGVQPRDYAAQGLGLRVGIGPRALIEVLGTGDAGSFAYTRTRGGLSIGLEPEIVRLSWSNNLRWRIAADGPSSLYVLSGTDRTRRRRVNDEDDDLIIVTTNRYAGFTVAHDVHAHWRAHVDALLFTAGTWARTSRETEPSQDFIGLDLTPRLRVGLWRSF